MQNGRISSKCGRIYEKTPSKSKKSLASVNKPIFQRAKEQDPAGTFAQNL
ncbi:hypothetical protein [Coxiella burnetii]|uniref:Uncharacterized protein n=1 Tax=Coxiella burnetii (strain RSA 493 / Nine Mile phase I) TaxID=227377 RepID=Q83AI0_COXBU|nr:hypothetical protein [Coxiella burnetii]NP_820883.1 hypothetical protein CBU_1906 [Coxiella burnetii RSA 493]AAO91397.1 hypothetical protein CBU_1906 [Coxiella burnetii RSA 493]ABX78543.1 hypothetical protein COXBURSA331_A2111 [Coxiella burnetii RSA 331]AML48207.1 hypothetical protein AUR58_02685 [Coxiella burnetii]AML54223.1 hypothetical protein AYM38_02320 [Coxiella burnetii]ARI66656.1 hypothetical protein B7L74_09830 [Coxiella burnetii]